MLLKYFKLHTQKNRKSNWQIAGCMFWMIEDSFLSSGLSSSQMPCYVENHVFERLSGTRSSLNSDVHPQKLTRNPKTGGFW